uniref:Uncharacterized protein n=1 Tax=Ixodes ricinus TaxID=34613 RepID=A0A6B0UEY5_IXORI
MRSLFVFYFISTSTQTFFSTSERIEILPRLSTSLFGCIYCVKLDSILCGGVFALCYYYFLSNINESGSTWVAHRMMPRGLDHQS